MKNFLRLYWKQTWRRTLCFLLVCALFAVSFWLYHLPMEAVWYPMALALLVVLAFGIWELRGSWRKYRRLRELSKLPGELMERFPEASCPEDGIYREILEKLRREQADSRKAMERQYQDMMDYYTLWVHQIKVPISSMDLQLQREDSPLSRRLSEELQRIEQYVSMVLAYLRLDSRVSDYVLREYDLDAIVRRAVKKFAGQFIRRRLQLTYTPAEIRVLTDEKWLCFVLEQILSNAVKYTQTGGVEIFSEGETLCVRDTGVGIAPEELPRIFEKGYTGSNGREDLRASGIGLYLCRQICRNLGHGIAVESEPGRGTTVRLDLSQVEFTPE